MTRSIYKYVLSHCIGSGQIYASHVPVDAEIVKVAFQNQILCVWAEVNPFALPGVFKTLRIYATGDHIMSPNETYRATVFDPNGLTVWHVFEDNQ